MQSERAAAATAEVCNLLGRRTTLPGSLGGWIAALRLR